MTRKRSDSLVGAIEAGGTKFVCAVGTGPHDLHRKAFRTQDNPAEVLSDVTVWLREEQDRRGQLRAIGIGSFGPIDLDDRSPAYGYITSTPKVSWKNTNILGAVQQAFPGLPVGFDTDVNAAALGENRWGNAVNLQDFVYVTIGTGIGGGGMSGGHLIHGLVHPEMGHMVLPRVPGDAFEGVCPYHGACWEGLCSGPALMRRSGIPADQLPAEHESWGLETQYIAYAIANIVCLMSPQRVIIGGSVRKAGRLGEGRFFEMIRERVQLALNGYVVAPALSEDVGSFIVPPLLGDDAGICGAIALAQRAIE